jgi:hypothetical protein
MPNCLLWEWRAAVIPQLDAVLVLERGGWPNGARVRTRGIPQYINGSGKLASEIGVSGDRAVIAAPVWHLDDIRAVIADGPPGNYELHYRELPTGLPSWTRSRPIAAQHLVEDTAPFPDPDPLAAIAASAAQSTSVDTVPQRASTENANPSTAQQHVVDELASMLDAPFRPALGPNWHRNMANTDDPHRVAAIRRLWELRDRELLFSGDSRPDRVLERTQRLRDQEKPPYAADVAKAEYSTDRVQQGRASLGLTDQHLVSGKPRELLSQWLEAMAHCTPRQLEVMDGLKERCSVDDVRSLLASEGFTEVATLNGIGGDAYLDVVAVQPDMGWLAITQAWELRPQCTRVYFNVELVDADILRLTAWRQAWNEFVDKAGRHPDIRVGDIYVPHHITDWSSLRVELAALRAFGRSIAPWVESPAVHLGADGAPANIQREALAALPSAVHSLLGPCLLSVV